MPGAIGSVVKKKLHQKRMRMLRSTTMGTPGIMTKILGTTLEATWSANHNVSSRLNLDAMGQKWSYRTTKDRAF
jgi:hypothetical protein